MDGCCDQPDCTIGMPLERSRRYVSRMGHASNETRAQWLCRPVQEAKAALKALSSFAPPRHTTLSGTV